MFNNRHADETPLPNLKASLVMTPQTKVKVQQQSALSHFQPRGNFNKSRMSPSLEDRLLNEDPSVKSTLGSGT